jgi:hypothetical protein
VLLFWGFSTAMTVPTPAAPPASKNTRTSVIDWVLFRDNLQRFGVEKVSQRAVNGLGFFKK